jgi:hypothetical protein
MAEIFTFNFSNSEFLDGNHHACFGLSINDHTLPRAGDHIEEAHAVNLEITGFKLSSASTARRTRTNTTANTYGEPSPQRERSSLGFSFQDGKYTSTSGLLCTIFRLWEMVHHFFLDKRLFCCQKIDISEEM